MKTCRPVPLIILAAALLSGSTVPVAAQSDNELIQMLRSDIAADRQAVVAQALQLTDKESQAFWPLYHRYRVELDKVADGLVKLVREYARYYPNVPQDRAAKMLKELMGLEKEHLATRTAYLKKFGKVLPADKNLRFAQVENRLDVAVRLKLAAGIPLVPIEGSLAGKASASAAVVEGVPGGAVVQTYELTATVTAIDKAGRKVTLLSPDGIKQTVKAGPEVVNFDQIRVGDQLKITATEELVVYVAGKGEPASDSGAALVALAPKGAKPGGLMTQTARVTAKVTAIDAEHHKATLQFEDGTTRTVAIRQDVDLSQRKVGDEVVIRTTESLAIKVGRP
jgi:hypothetical protein